MQTKKESHLPNRFPLKEIDTFNSVSQDILDLFHAYVETITQHVPISEWETFGLSEKGEYDTLTKRLVPKGAKALSLAGYVGLEEVIDWFRLLEKRTGILLSNLAMKTEAVNEILIKYNI